MFADFDDKIDPFLKSEYDHGILIHVNDPLYDSLVEHTRRTGEQLKMKRFQRPTTVENLAHLLFTEITDLGFCLERIEVRETDTSVLSYMRDNWVEDNRHFAQQRAEQKLAVH